MLDYMHLTDKQDLTHNDMADPRELNEIIWFSVRGEEPMPMQIIWRCSIFCEPV